MNRAKRQSQPAITRRTVVAQAQVGAVRPLVIELGGWCVTLRTQAVPKSAHGWHARRILRTR